MTSSASPDGRTFVSAVFVLADGTVETVILPIEDGRSTANWRRPRRAWSVSVERNPPVRTTDATEEFTRRGQMFDKRPVYCADGFDVKEAYQIHMVTSHEYANEQARQAIRDNMAAFVEQDTTDAIVLDRWEGDVPFTFMEEGLEHEGLRKVGLRTLVAVRVSRATPVGFTPERK